MGSDDGDVLDRARLRELVEAYAALVDARDTDRFRDLFTDDARLTVHEGDGPAVGGYVGADDIAQIPGKLARHAHTAHLVSTGRWSIAGDTATGVVRCEAHHVGRAEGPDRTDLVMTIRYDDRYRRDAEGRWRIEQREVHKLWTRTLPVTVLAVDPPPPPHPGGPS